jgi:hypothetical protein
VPQDAGPENDLPKGGRPVQIPDRAQTPAASPRAAALPLVRHLADPLERAAAHPAGLKIDLAILIVPIQQKAQPQDPDPIIILIINLVDEAVLLADRHTPRRAVLLLYGQRACPARLDFCGCRVRHTARSRYLHLLDKLFSAGDAFLYEPNYANWSKKNSAEA